MSSLRQLLGLAWRFLWARPLATGLNLGLLSLGLAAVHLVAMLGQQLERGLTRDLQGIDLVVGAKGSPLQLMLATVYHLDVPQANIPADSLGLLRAHPLVDKVVPLSLGDSFQGFRILGTEVAYAEITGVNLASGQWWQAPMQAVLGAQVAQRSGLTLGQSFAGSHGLGQGGPTHDGAAYQVVGVMAACGCVADRLILTDTRSVWVTHAAHGHSPPEKGSSKAADQAHEHEHDHDEAHGNEAASHAEVDALPPGAEVTAALLRYRSPMAAVSLPRWVNAQPQWQAASPALESARLMRMVGLGVEVLRGFGLLLLLVAGVSVFLALTHAVREREPDLAMLRMLGAPPAKLACLVSFEALWLVNLGLLGGLVVGHGLMAWLAHLAQAQQGPALSPWTWAPHTPWLIVGAWGLALVAAAWPAWRASRSEVTRLLHNRA